MLAVTNTTTIAILIVVAICLAWVVYAIQNVRAGRDEVGSELELAANRKEYFEDEVLEGPRLERVQVLGVAMLLIISIVLPAYWIFEPSRQVGSRTGLENRLARWGGELFTPTSEGGFNCAGCHGGMKATGGGAPFTVVDPLTGESAAVSWNAPALNTVMYRYSADEIRQILIYGRPFSPMSPWGLAGGGPMNEQQIDSLVEYIRSIQLQPIGCLAEGKRFDTSVGGRDPAVCDGGQLPEDKSAEINKAVADLIAKQGMSEGEALYNLSLDGGAYSCARCHTSGWSWGNPGPDGSGAFGWNLTGSSLAQHFPIEAENIDFVASGSAFGKKYGRQGQGNGRMPGFGSYLTPDQLKELVEYVRSL